MIQIKEEKKKGLSSYWKIIEDNLFRGHPSYRAMVDDLIKEREEGERELKKQK